MSMNRLRSMPDTRDALEIFSLAFNCSPAPMRLFRFPDGVTVDINNSYEKILGYKREEIVNQDPVILGVWFDCILDPRNIYSLLQKQGQIKDLPARLRKKDGTIIPTTIQSEIIELNGEKYGVVSFEDISLHKSFEESLRESEQRFHNIFNNNPDPLAIYDIDTLVILEANTAYERQSGYAREEIIGINARDLVSTPKMLKDLEMTMMSLGKVENQEVEIVSKSGERSMMLLSVEIIEYGGKPVYLVSGKDISGIRKMDRSLARLERFNLIGQMSASIGHEIRNPMTTIKGFLQLLGNQEQDEKKKGYYDIMIMEVDRANSIISEFLDLAHDKAKRFQLGDINSVLEAIHPLLTSDINKQEKLLTLELGSIPKVMIDEKEIRQLVFNLFNNGLEAMEKGGQITIKTYLENNQVVLMVQDTGCGIDPSLLEKVGNPFFTTKDQGTGLGLAVCYSIANRHSAEMDFTSNESGTTFYTRFAIPQSDKI